MIHLPPKCSACEPPLSAPERREPMQRMGSSGEVFQTEERDGQMTVPFLNAP